MLNYVDMITEKLAKKEFTYFSSFGHKSTVAESMRSVKEKLKYIPKANLKRVWESMDKLISRCKEDLSFAKFMQVAAQEGLLSFEPYITENSHGTPTLVLKYGRYVHLFRGYNYQCSYTAEGIGEYSSSGVRIDQIRSLFKNFDLEQSKLLKYLYYMNLIHCCCGIDAFNDLLEHNPEVIDEFMRRSTSELFDNWEVKYVDDIANDVVGFIGYGDNYRGKGPGFLEPKKTFRIPMSETTDYARINIYDNNKVGIECWVEGRLTEVVFTLPNPWDSEVQLENIADDWDDEPKEMEWLIKHKIYDSYEVRCTLVSFALNFCGFITNFLVTYPTPEMKSSKLRALNRTDIPEFKNLGTLYSKEN